MQLRGKPSKIKTVKSVTCNIIQKGKCRWIEKEIVDLCCNHNLITSSLILQQATGNFLLGNPVSGFVCDVVWWCFLWMLCVMLLGGFVDGQMNEQTNGHLYFAFVTENNWIWHLTILLFCISFFKSSQVKLYYQ